MQACTVGQHCIIVQITFKETTTMIACHSDLRLIFAIDGILVADFRNKK